MNIELKHNLLSVCKQRGLLTSKHIICHAKNVWYAIRCLGNDAGMHLASCIQGFYLPLPQFAEKHKENPCFKPVTDIGPTPRPLSTKNSVRNNRLVPTQRVVICLHLLPLWRMCSIINPYEASGLDCKSTTPNYPFIHNLFIYDL